MNKKQDSEKTLVERLIEKGKEVVKTAKKMPDRAKPLGELLAEKNTFSNVNRYLCPIQHYIAEYLVRAKQDPDYMVNKHPEFPNSSLLKGMIEDFRDAKYTLNQSILFGEHFTAEKKELQAMMEQYEKDYISGNNPIIIGSVELMNEHQVRAQALMAKGQHIAQGYNGMEDSLRKPYDESWNAIGQVALGSAAVVGLAAIALPLMFKSKVAATAAKGAAAL